jgi:hypothetical protein
MLRSGCSISSATLATFVTPAYETYTKPVAARRPPTPPSKKPSKRAGSTSPRLPPTNHAMAASITATRTTWMRPVCLTPSRFTTMSTPAMPRASAWGGHVEQEDDVGRPADERERP